MLKQLVPQKRHNGEEFMKDGSCLFLPFRLIYLSVQLVGCWDLNFGYLLSEANALPTEPQPLPQELSRPLSLAFFPIYNFRFRTFHTRTLFVLADSNTSVLGVSGRKCTTRLSATRMTRSSTPPPRTTSCRRSFSVQRILFRRPPSSCSLCSSWPQRTSTLISSHLKSTLEKVLTCYEDGWSLSSC